MLVFYTTFGDNQKQLFHLHLLDKRWLYVQLCTTSLVKANSTMLYPGMAVILDFRFSDSDSVALFTKLITYTNSIYRNYINKKEKRNIRVNSKSEMCSVT